MGDMSLADCHCLACRDYGDADNLDTHNTRLLRQVRRQGWGVYVDPPTERLPPVAYTVGLWHTCRSPEFAMFGTDPAVMTTCLNLIGVEVEQGRRITATEILDDVLDGYRVTVRRIDPAWHQRFFGPSRNFYRATKDVPWLQVVWPDKQNRFPGDPGYAPPNDEVQPQLWLPRDDHPPGPWTKR